MQTTLEVLREIGEIIPDPWVIVDRDGRILAYNRRFFGLFPREVGLRLEGEQLDAIARFESAGEGKPVDVVGDGLSAREAIKFGMLHVGLHESENLLTGVSASPLREKNSGVDATVWGAMVTFKDEGRQHTKETPSLEGIDPAGAAGQRLLELGEQVRRLRAENARLRRRLYV